MCGMVILCKYLVNCNKRLTFCLKYSTPYNEIDQNLFSAFV
jgi:hypothetical protein